jgi:hypothetical protein
MVIFVPATSPGEAVPVPPFAIGSKPETPVVRGSAVALLKLSVEGVPKLGVTRTGELERTFEPLPVEVVTPVPPLETPRTPVTPVVSGKPVALVRTAADGVPRFGVVKTGEVVSATTVPLPDVL